MFIWKIYEVEDEDGKRRHVIAHDEIKVEEHLELGEVVTTDSFLSDMIPGCEPEDIFIVPV